MNYSTVKIPLSPVAKKYFEKRFQSRIDDQGYIRADKNSAIGMKIIHYMDLWFSKWELPVIQGNYIKVRLPKSYIYYGIQDSKLKELSKIMEMEAMEYLVHEIACAAQYPGVSVTEAIITVMARYDISEEDYRTDSMRRHFDRYCAEVVGEPFKDFSHKINSAIKVLYERLASKSVTFDQMINV